MTPAQIGFLKDFLKHHLVKNTNVSDFDEKENDKTLVHVRICNSNSGIPKYYAYIKKYEPSICIKKYGSEFISDGIMDFHFWTIDEARKAFQDIFGC